MENKYQAGDIVFANEDPAKKLVVRRYLDRIYYCTVVGDSPARELPYFERELVNNEKRP